MSIPSYSSSSPPPSNTKLVLLFWADWHEESVGLKDQILPALATSSSTQVEFGSIEAEQDADWSSNTYGVTVVPSIVLVNSSGKVQERLEGQVQIPEITQAVLRLQNSSTSEDAVTEAPPAPTPTTPETLLNDRLKQLVHSSEVMLFIKGSPEAPRCGFSRQAVELLEAEQIPFGSFDILSDEDVRQGLKAYSDWPTYPQLYVRGELQGGLDILKEMAAEDGGLAQQLELTAQPSLDKRLEQLIHQSHVMLFMKGLPSAPKCGFSRQMCELLANYKADFGAYNILQDDEVREGLKKYSDWPTYPQLYIDGDLIGGLDICKEMAESGDLQELLQAASSSAKQE